MTGWKTVKIFHKLLNTNKEHFTKRLFSDVKNFDAVLIQNEDKVEYPGGCGVSKVYANQIGSHSPIQDAWGEASLIHSPGVMFGVFDGNNGTACSHVVSKRIFDYVAVTLLPKDVLERYLASSEDRFRHLDINKSLQFKHFFLEEYRKTYEKSLYSYARDLLKRGVEYDIKEALTKSYERLDSDMSREAMEDTSQDKRMLWVGMTGTCGTVLHMSGGTLTTAISGDALVVVGTERGEAKVLTPEHNVENAEEVERVRGEHPGEEGVLDQGLLLGSLTSFRSFGNFRYKWSKEKVEEKLVPVYGKEAAPERCLSPPYISVRPDVGQYSLQSEDRFIVLASDGIWDIFPPEKVVEIISNHKPVSSWRKTLLLPLRKLQKLRQILRKEETEKEETVVFRSPATQLINEALDSTSKKLHLPKRYIRHIRDDMTVLVIYLDGSRVKEKVVHPKTEENYKNSNTLTSEAYFLS